MVDISEKNFEATIEAVLLHGGPDENKAEEVPIFSEEGEFVPGGFLKRVAEEYDRELCLIPEDAINFIKATQPNEWQKLKTQYGNEAEQRFLKRLSKEIEKRGTLDVLRKGIKDVGARIKMVYFRPSSEINPDLRKKYLGNIFGVMRQLKYHPDRELSIDLGIFLNGMPIFTIEVKNPLTNQTVENAIWQYKYDRDPKDPLLIFGRCLAHFAVDPELVFFTTNLRGPDTRFFPFNKGRYGGAGNIPRHDAYPAAYLWEQTLAKDSILNLLEHFIYVVEEENEEGKKTGRKFMIFPRYHQLEAVRSIINHAREHGSGQKYLVQHSAGSGKSYSIAWLAHQLSVLHNQENNRIFDSIVVITDRRVLDSQLQTTIRQFEQTLGVVENIDTTSRQLKQALEDGKTIIVSTLQKFPVIAAEIEKLSGSRFAVIADEAHSSQSGEAARQLRAVLSVESLEEAEQKEEAIDESVQDEMEEHIRSHGVSPNVSFFAFTATPKSKTLELFGTKRPDGKYEAFSLYSMRQAIEEGFIMDVLDNYTTYKTYWKLLKKIEDDPRYDQKKAEYLLKQFVDIHDHTIGKKIEIIVRHFEDHVQDKVDGKAKAMITTRSRKHAVRYKLALDDYLKEQGLPFKALVAFSGTVKDKGKEYTEPSMNEYPKIPTEKVFDQDKYRFMVVAEKFQTGFDQPKLHTMYVDKKLAGLHAVQTLSRINRTHPDKEETMILDFANEADVIKKAFEPYYEKTLLSESTNPNKLYDLETALEEFYLYTQEDIDKFSEQFYSRDGSQAVILGVLRPIAERYLDLEKEKQTDFKGKLKDYIRLYAFLSQVITFVDVDLDKLYNFGRYLIRLLYSEPEELPYEIKSKIDLESLSIQRSFEGKIVPDRGEGEIHPPHPEGVYRPSEEDLEALSKIIKELNKRFGTNFSDEDKVFIETLEQKLSQDPVLESSMRVNSEENFRLTFDDAARDAVQEMIDTNFKFYKQINDDKEFAKQFFNWLFDRYRDAAEAD